MKYKIWLDDWLRDYVSPQVKLRTYARYSEIVKQHIEKSLGEYELEELTAQIVQGYITELLRVGNLKTEQGLAPNSVNAIITLIQNSLKTAYDLGMIREYFGDKIKRPKSRERQIECLSATEQKRIESAALADNRDKMFGIVICLYSGLRIGELLGLEWSDVDLSSGKLTVKRSSHDGFDENGIFGRIVDTPKTPSSVRTIPLPRQLLPKLREQKHKSISRKYVVEDKIGEPVSVRSYQSSFKALLKRLGMKNYGFHSLRHSFATRAIECGMDVRTLSEILGHKNPTVTLNRYVHSMYEHKCEMMNKVGKFLA